MISPAETLAPERDDSIGWSRIALELWLLQAVMFSREWRAIVWPLLRASDFADPSHVYIYRSCAVVFKLGLLCDHEEAVEFRKLMAHYPDRVWLDFVDRFCGQYDIDMPIDLAFDDIMPLLRGDAPERDIASYARFWSLYPPWMLDFGRGVKSGHPAKV